MGIVYHDAKKAREVEFSNQADHRFERLGSGNQNPARIVELVERWALMAWRSKIDCPPELVDVRSKREFITRYSQWAISRM